MPLLANQRLWVRPLAAVLWLAGVLASLLPSAADAANRVVKVGIYDNAPKVFMSESGRASGIFVDIIEDIASREGWSLTYVFGTWAEGLARLKRGEIDLMPDVAYSPDRGKVFAFHRVPVLSSWFQVVARPGSGIHSVLDMNDRRILVLERSVQEEAFQRLSKGFGVRISIVTVPDFRTMFEMVARGEADAGITNRFYALRHAAQHGLEPTSVVFEPSDLFFAAPIGAPDPILDAIDANVRRLKQDPGSAYYVSLKRWMSEEVRFALPGWAKPAALLAGLFLVLSLAGTFVLKHQVNARTQELLQLNRDMEKRVEERTGELEKAMEGARHADRVKSAFLATMSHELRTPLNSIIGFTGIILRELAGPLTTEQRKQLTMVQDSSRHLLALINDVLDISKIEAGQLEIFPTTFDPTPSLQKQAEVVGPAAVKKGIELRLDLGDAPGTITADQRRLEQIVLNLLTNAVKFTEKGHVTLSFRRDGDLCTLAVADTGIGIRPEDLPTLFQPFHQLDAGLTRRHEGSGLGLSICRRLAEKMAGSIRAESEPGKGSTFIVTLPVRPAGAPA